jgi:uncharacterized delta-60 repeat protein
MNSPARRWPGLRPGLAAALASILCLLLAGSAQPRSSERSAASFDPTFAGRGFVVNPELGRIEVEEDARGRLLVAGGRDGELLAARYLPTGRLDRSFGAGGVARIALPGFGSWPPDAAKVRALAIQPDGKLLIGGSFQAAPGTGLGSSAVLARLNPNGALDAGFGNSQPQDGEPGMVILSAREIISAIALQGRKILVGGSSGTGFVGRFNPDGSLDRGFGGGRLGGWFNLPPRPRGKTRYKVEAGVEGLLTGPRRTIYAAGYANGSFMLARLRNDGHLDRGFGGGGVVKTDASGRRACACSIGEGLARDSRGRLLVSGSVLSRHRGPRQAIAVARFRQDGSLDRSFAAGGIARTRLAPEAWGGPLVVGPSGRIVVAGSASEGGGTYRLALVGYRPGGRLDPTFFGDGIFKAGFGAASSEATDLLVDRQGRLVAAAAARFSPPRSESGQSALLARLRSR